MTAVYIALCLWFGVACVIGPIVGRCIAWGEE